MKNLKIKKSKKQNKILKRRLFGALFLLLMIFLGVNLFKSNTYKSHKTEFPKYLIYKEQVLAKAYILPNEKVYKAAGDGIALYNASEGQKVPVGYEIASINLMNDVSSLKDELIRVNEALKYKTKDTKQDEKVTEKEIESIKKIQEDLKYGNLSSAIGDINGLDINTRQSISISELTELMNLSVDELKEKKEKLVKQISVSNIYYNAEYSGIVSYKEDGLENNYDEMDLDQITCKYLESHKNTREAEPKTQVNKGDILFKLIDNFTYKIALDVKDINELGDIKIGDKLTLENKNIKKLRGRIININRCKGNRAVIILQLDEQFDKLYSKRIYEMDVIKNKIKCFEIPKSAIIKRDGLFGVYVEELHGLVNFVPIDIVKELENTKYVSIGDKRGFIKIGKKEYKTITINDAIVVNPKTVDESQVLN